MMARMLTGTMADLYPELLECDHRELANTKWDSTIVCSHFQEFPTVVFQTFCPCCGKHFLEQKSINELTHEEWKRFQ